ncbi:MAG TPA: Bax inhibitor-1/YccA family protein [Beijerinckiaceae bacterium]|mgnify:CR=1 FL=1|nr:Bax inhibitor-1/YccA family protein [Beijerinckiaceae bacterium]
MSNFERNAYVPYGGTVATQAQIDQGLRSYMLGVYNHMVLGLAITGLAALGFYMLSVTTDQAMAVGKLKNGTMLTQFGAMLYTSPLKWVVMFAPLAVVFFFSFRIQSMSAAAARGTFWLYAALVGVSLTTVFFVFTHTSIVRVFFITAASFGALSLFGYTTKKDLSGMGSFLIMGLIGLMIASIVNIFLGSTGLQWAISMLGVLIFAGLTAYDTQNIKNMYYESMGSEMAEKLSVYGALQLYMDFLGMFQMLLSLLGDRE